MTRRITRRAVIAGWLVVCTRIGGVSFAQDDSPDVPGHPDSEMTVLVPHSVLDSKAVRVSLQQAGAWIRDGRYADACTALQEIIDRYPNHLVNLGNGLFRGAHEHAVELLLTLPPDGIAVYRAKYDAEAKLTLDRALRDRDPARLQAMLLRFAATSYGDDALDALASLLLEHGDAAEALYYLEEIPRSHAGSDLDSALRLAKVGFCHGALGDTAALRADLETARRRFPEATVRIGGTPFKLADYLASRARIAAQVVRAAPQIGWERLGGDNTNSRVQTPLSPGLEKQWRTDLGFEVTREEAPFDGLSLADSLSDIVWAPYYPTVSGGNVFVHNGLWIDALNLYNGKRRWSFHGPMDRPTGERDLRQSFSATVADGIVYVNLEVPVDTQPRNYRYTPIIQPIPERKLFAIAAETGKALWRHDHFDAASEEEDVFIRRASAPTAPLVWRDLVIAAESYFEGKVHSYLCGFDRMTGHLRWKTLVCTGQQELNMFGQPWREHITSPLAEDDGVVYFSTNLGYCAAVDARTGLIRWISEYPQVQLPISRNYQPVQRPLTWFNNPPILTDTTVYATPLDSRDLLALDRKNGAFRSRTLRPEGPRDARYVFGLTRSALVLADQGLFFVDLQTGAQRLPGTIFGNPRESTVGRGAVTSSGVLCPTDTGLYQFDPDTGRATGESRRWGSPDEGGNVLSLDGFLIVVSEKEVSVHYRWEELFQRLTRDIERNPADPEPLLRLADAYEQGGKLDPAAETYQRAVKLAASLTTPEADRVAREARRGLYQVYENLAQKALLAGDWERAAPPLAEASRFAYDDETRIRSLLNFEQFYRAKGDEAGLASTFSSMIDQVGEAPYDFYRDHSPLPAGLYACLSLGEYYRERKRPGEAVKSFQEIIRRFPHVRFRGAEAGRFAKEQIDLLIAAVGTEAYAPFEREARSLFERAKSRKDETGLRRILQDYPNSSVTEECLIDLARILKEAGRRNEAVKALRNFLQSFPDSRLRPEVIADVAAAYEGEGFVESAAAVLRYLLQRHPSEFLSVEGQRTGVDVYARERLKNLPAEPSAPPQQGLPARVTELWKHAYPGASNITMAKVEGADSPFFADHVFFISNRMLMCVRRSEGEPVWSLTSLGEIPKDQVVCQDGVLVVTTVHEAVAVRAETGEELWRVATDTYIKSVKGGIATIVLSLESASAMGGGATSHLLRALDLFTGGVVWERTLPGRQFGEPGTLGNLLWTVSTPIPGRASVFVFDLFTGQMLWEIEPEKDPSVNAYSTEACALGTSGLALYSNARASNSLRLYDVARHAVQWEVSLKGFLFRRMQRVGGDIALFLLRTGTAAGPGSRQPTHVIQVRAGSTGDLLFQRELPGDGILNLAEVADDTSRPGGRPDTIYLYRVRTDSLVLIAVDSTTSGAVRYEQVLEHGQASLKRIHVAGSTVVCEVYPQLESEQRLAVKLLDASSGEPRQPELSFDLSGSFASDVAIVGGTLCVAIGNRLYCYGQ